MWSASSSTVISTASSRTAAGDHDVDAAIERVDLRACPNPAEHRRRPEADPGREGSDDLVDLACQLAGRREDQTARRGTPRRVVGLGEALYQRQDECQGLAGAGSSPAEDVTAGQRVGKGCGLNGERTLDSLTGEVGGQLG
jgi:hypothetical protein